MFPENQNLYRSHTTTISAKSESMGEENDTNVEVRKDILSVSLTLYSNEMMDSAMYVYKTGCGGFLNDEETKGDMGSLECVIKGILSNKFTDQQEIKQKTESIVEIYNLYKNLKGEFGQLDAIAIKNEILDEVAYISKSYGKPGLQKNIQEYIYILKTNPNQIGSYYIKLEEEEKGFTAEEMTFNLLKNPQARIVISHELLQKDNNMIIKEAILCKDLQKQITAEIENSLREALL